MQAHVLSPVPIRPTPSRPAKRPTTLSELVDHTSDLPAMPTVALATHKESGRPGATAASVADLVASDPALTARVLRLANSAYYGNARQVAAVSDAIMLLGMKSVRNLCLLAGTYPWLKGGLPAYGLGPGALMTHSLATAVAAKAMAEHARIDADAAFTAGLLHDLGKVALSMWATRADDVVRSPEDERRTMGFDHGAVGGELARRWNLPFPLVGAIACHHTPTEGLEDAVHAGDAIAHLLTGEEPSTLDAGALDRLGLTNDVLSIQAESLKPEFGRHLKLLEGCA